MHRIISLLVIASTNIFACSLCLADLKSDFLSRYQPAADRLDEEYSHATISATTTIYDRQGNPVGRDYVYKRDGEKYLARFRNTSSASPNYVVDYEGATGGTASRFFEISKQPGRRNFALDNFGPQDLASFNNLRETRYPPFYFATWVNGYRVADFMRLLGVAIESVTPCTIDGQHAVNVVAKIRLTPLKGKDPVDSRISYFFQEGNLAIISVKEPRYDRPGDSSESYAVSETHVEYDPVGSFQIKHFKQWVANVKTPDVHLRKKEFNITKLNFGPVPDRDFTLASFGMREPATPTTSGLLKWVMILNGGIGLILFVLYLFRAKRPSQRDVNPAR